MSTVCANDVTKYSPQINTQTRELTALAYKLLTVLLCRIFSICNITFLYAYIIIRPYDDRVYIPGRPEISGQKPSYCIISL